MKRREIASGEILTFGTRRRWPLLVASGIAAFSVRRGKPALPFAKSGAGWPSTRDRGDVPSEVIENTLPILALLVHGGSRFGNERLMDDDARLGLRTLAPHMTRSEERSVGNECGRTWTSRMLQGD